MIGLGIMGRPMAKNLLKASYDLAAANRNKAVADEPVSVEARASPTLRSALLCSLVLTMSSRCGLVDHSSIIKYD